MCSLARGLRKVPVSPGVSPQHPYAVIKASIPSALPFLGLPPPLIKTKSPCHHCAFPAPHRKRSVWGCRTLVRAHRSAAQGEASSIRFSAES